MINAITESPITLTEAATLCPRRRNGKHPHVSCLYRWTTAGCKGVVLESIQAGGTRCTSREALARFFRRLTARQGLDAPATSAADGKRGTAPLETELDLAGI